MTRPAIDVLLGDVLDELRVSPGSGPAITGETAPALLASPLAVPEAAVATVAACLVAAADLAEARGRRRPAVSLDAGHATAAVVSEALLTDPNGKGIAGFAPLSRLWPSADGWVRTHANYAWHRAALLAALGLPDDGDDDRAAPLVAEAIAAEPSAVIEDRVYAGGGLAVAARTVDEWTSHPAGRAIAAQPLVQTVPVGGAAGRLPEPVPLPASGVRVLDLTRVIAGPVATRMLAALGANVLRVDSPTHPDQSPFTVDGIVGKASTFLDGRTEIGRATLDDLVEQAHVVVTGYRPGALDEVGLSADRIAGEHPGTVVVTLSAWGRTGPWGARRGFDSLVQVATGIGWATSVDGTTPGALPCQLLDHGSGYLTAAAVLAALAEGVRTGQTTHRHLALARTAGWLLDLGIDPDPPERSGAGALEAVERFRVPFGNGWSGVAPPGALDGARLAWPHLPPRYGEASPVWD